MNRRQALAAIAGYLLATQNEARAQARSSRALIVRVLSGAGPLPGTEDAFLQALHEAGLEQGRDFDLIMRTADNDTASRPRLAKEAIGLNPAILLSGDTPLTVELRRATDTIPIIAVGVTDPVGLGLADSLARPGKNVTGVLGPASTPGKLVELLLEVVPDAKKLGALYNPTNPGNVLGINFLKRETAALPISLVSLEVGTPADIEPAFRHLVDEMAGAVLVSQDAVFTGEPQKIADLALAARLPSIFGFRLHVEAGGLMSYGSNFPQRYRMAGEYAAKILKGAKPGDLPIQLQPKLELVINLRTAKALGLDIPRSVLARADEVIE